MFTTLLESRSARTRRRGGTTISVLLHGALIAAGVTATTQKQSFAAPDKPVEQHIHIVPIKPVKPLPQRPIDDVRTPATHFSAPPVDVIITPPTFTPTDLPPISTGPEIPPDRIGVAGLTHPELGAPGGTPLTSGGAVDVAYVERAPALYGKPREPRYPAMLSQSGINGHVVVRFVIDTLGRAEMGDLTVVESSHALFTDAVRAVLGDYRFTPGEVGGKKVRTLVQMPFSFAVR